VSLIRVISLAISLFVASLFAHANEVNVPDGFVLQRLEATDGRIAMPKDWYYRSSGTQSGWLYTFSKEKPDPYYETGLRIQMLMDVEKKTKLTKEEFVNSNIELKKKDATEVVKDCKVPTDAGFFMRKCLEVIENIRLGGNPPRPFRLQYSYSWAKTMDMVVVHTFGTPIDKWDEFKDVSNMMNGAILIGPNLGKNADMNAQPK
jgi:hypothetical protein